MKVILVAVFLLGLAIGCNQQSASLPYNTTLVPSGSMVYTDSAYTELASEFNNKKLKLDTLTKGYDSLKYLSDSLRVKLFLAQYKVENVKNYIKIVKHNPSQMKFFLGWVDRAVR